MCLEHYFRYDLCRHESLTTDRTYPAAPSCSPNDSLKCKQHKRIRTVLASEFCQACFFFELKTQKRLASSHVLFPIEKSYGEAEAAEAEIILSRAREYLKSSSLLTNVFVWIDLEPLPSKVRQALSWVYWLLNCRFWSLLKEGKKPIGIEERLLIIKLRVALEHEIRNEQFIKHFPPSRKDYLLQKILIPVNERNEEMDAADTVCPISMERFREPSGDQLADHPVRVKACNHLFGERSITNWLETNSTCPLDRSEILPLFEEASDFQSYIETKRLEQTRNDPAPEHLQILDILLGGIQPKDLPNSSLLPQIPMAQTDYLKRIDPRCFVRGREKAWLPYIKVALDRDHECGPERLISQLGRLAFALDFGPQYLD